MKKENILYIFQGPKEMVHAVLAEQQMIEYARKVEKSEGILLSDETAIKFVHKDKEVKYICMYLPDNTTVLDSSDEAVKSFELSVSTIILDKSVKAKFVEIFSKVAKHQKAKLMKI